MGTSSLISRLIDVLDCENLTLKTLVTSAGVITQFATYCQSKLSSTCLSVCSGMHVVVVDVTDIGDRQGGRPQQIGDYSLLAVCLSVCYIPTLERERESFRMLEIDGKNRVYRKSEAERPLLAGS